ncbi:hypothetical protein cypCar_00049561, partial [Cyprinus carpio]
SQRSMEVDSQHRVSDPTMGRLRQMLDYPMVGYGPEVLPHCPGRPVPERSA